MSLILTWGLGPFFTVVGVPMAADPHAGRLSVTNRQTQGHGTFTEGQIDLGNGLVVGVVVRHNFADEPDEVRVTVPEGYIAIPDRFLIDEDATGTVEIYRVYAG